ncbi:MAG: glycosyltransferase family 4 protein [Nitrospirae bacterium]|nr:glycosyltransferase family 4 protein [Nitrospirota bacterium]
MLTISHQVKSDIVRSYHISPENVQVTHLAVDHALYTTIGPSDSEEIKARYGLPDRFILYAASSLPHKNHGRLLQAFELVRRRIPDLGLVLIGARDKGYEALAQQIAASGLTQEVLLLAWLPFEEVPSIFRACEAFVFPTLHEGFGLPVIEAMACGVPVVCSKIEPLMEIAGDAAFFVDPYSQDKISEGISSVLLDLPLRQSLIEKGKSRCREFTWEATARKTLHFLQSVHMARRRNR